MIALISMIFFIQKMEFHVTYSNKIFGNDMVMHIKIVTLFSDIHDLLPFDYPNVNELDSTW